MQSRLPTQIRVCVSGKRVIRSKTRARQMAQFMSRRNDDYLEPYVCDYCGCWHVGHAVWNPERKRR